MKKYELTDDIITKPNGDVLHRIKAVRDFGNVKIGDVGGYIEKEENLSHDGNARVCDDAQVFGNALVSGNAQVFGNACVCGDAQVFGNAQVRCNRDYFYDHGCGREQRTTTFFRTKDGKIGVRCGCFYGDMDEFRKKVKETHGDSKMAEEYLMLADFNEFRFGKEN